MLPPISEQHNGENRVKADIAETLSFRLSASVEEVACVRGGNATKSVCNLYDARNVTAGDVLCRRGAAGDTMRRHYQVRLFIS